MTAALLASHNPNSPLDWFWVVLSFVVLAAILTAFVVPVAFWVTDAVRRTREPD